MRIKGKQLEDTLRTADNPFEAIHATQFVGAMDGSLRFKCKNAESIAMSKGQAVYISGVSGDVPEVKLADADGTGTVPAVGLTESAANASAEVFVVSFGNLTGLDTSSLNTTSPVESIVGRSVFVGTTPGQVTIDKPAGSSAKLQNIGQIVREHATEGIIKVGGAGRTAATPNLDQGKFFIGNTSNQSSESAYTLPTAIGTSGQVLTSDGTNVGFADASGGGSEYTEVTANITAANLEATFYYINPKNTTSFNIQLPNWWDYDSLTTSLEDKRIVIHNEGSVSITLTAINANDYNVSGNNDYYNRLYDLEGNQINVSSNQSVLTIPARTSIIIDLEKYYDSSVNLYAHYLYWRTYYYVDKSVSSLTDTSISSPADNDILVYNSSTSKWESSSDRGELQFSYKFGNFIAEPGYYYYVDTSSADITVSLSTATPTVVGTRFKIFKASSANSVIIQESNAINVIDPDDGAAGQTSRSIQARSMIEFIVTTTGADYTYIITPQIEINHNDLNESGEFLIYDASTGANHLIASPYKLPTADGVANQVLQTDGSGTLSFATVSGGGSSSPPTVTVNTSLGANLSITTHTNNEEIYILTPTANVEVILPSASSCGQGYKYQVKNMSASYSLTINPNSTETVDGQPTIIIGSQYESLTLVSDGSASWYVI